MKKGSIRKPLSLSKGFLVRLLISYALVALLPTLISFQQYSSRSNEAFTQQRDAALSLLTQSRNAYDSGIKNLDNILSAALINSELREIGSTKNPYDAPQSIYRFVKAQKQMATLGYMSPLVNDILLYNAPGQFILTTKTVYLNPLLFPSGMRYQYPGIQWPDDLLTIFSGTQAVKQQWLMLDNIKDGSALSLYANTIYWNDHVNTLIIILSPQKLKDILFHDGVTDIMIVGRQNELLSGVPAYSMNLEQLKAIEDYGVLSGEDGERYLVCATTSLMTGMRCYSITPYAIVLQSVQSLRNTFLLLMSLVALTTFGLCIGFAQLNLKPMHRLLNLLFGANSSALPASLINWEMMDAAVHRILAENKELSTEIATQKAALVSNLMYDLLNDREGNQDRIIKRLQTLDVQTEQPYWMLLMELHDVVDSDRDSAEATLLMHRLIEKHLAPVFHIADVTIKRFAILIRDIGQEQDEIRYRFDGLRQEMAMVINLDARGCAMRATSLSVVTDVYRQELVSLEWHKEGGNLGLEPIMDYNFDEVALYYPFRLEQQLSASIANGNADRFAELLEEIYRENFLQQHISDPQMDILWEKICATVSSSLLRMADLPGDILLSSLRALHVRNHLESYTEKVHALQATLAAVFILAKKDDSSSNVRKTQMGRKIVSFIHENISDPNFCLNAVAEALGLSAPYISSLLKDETGSSFQNYCERLRIANACDLLAEGVSVQEVSVRVGYFSPHTFRHAFKKVVGVAPSQYSAL